jgi:cytochrome c556
MRIQFVLTVAVLLAGIPTISGHGEDAKNDLKALMKKKLESSQKVLEGLALNDFDTISKHAGELSRISKATEFRVLKTPEFELYSNQFRRSVETMDGMAKTKNLDGAALAYVELTLTCVKCHQHVREVRMAMK